MRSSHKVKDLAHEGNVRRIIVKDPDGKTLIEVPASPSKSSEAVVAPVAAAVGATAELAADYAPSSSSGGRMANRPK